LKNENEKHKKFYHQLFFMATEIEIDMGLERITRKYKNVELTIEPYRSADEKIQHGFFVRIPEKEIKAGYYALERDLPILLMDLLMEEDISALADKLSALADKIYQQLRIIGESRSGTGTLKVYLLEPGVKPIIREMLEEYLKSLHVSYASTKLM
jgi:hypothetical protein